MENQTSMSSYSSGMSMKDMSPGFETTLLKDFQNQMASSGSNDSLFSASALFNLGPNKRPFQDVDGTAEKGKSSSAAVAPNAITAFLQGQLESIQAKRRKCDDGQSARSPSAGSGVDDPLLTKQMEPVAASTLKQADSASIQALRARRVSDYSWTNLSLDNLQRYNSTSEAGSRNSQQRQQKIQPAAQPAPMYAATAPAAPQASSPITTSAESETAFYLHRVCRHFATQKEIVEIALTMDPQAIRRKAEPVKTPKSNRLIGRMRPEQYGFPINIALQNGASTDVLELLINSGKDVLLQKDGREQTATLAIALTHKPQDLDLIELIMFANLPSLMVTDRKHNYPLHVACSKGASLAVLERLYLHYPAALFHKNFNGETPLDIARRTSTMEEQALNFLYEKYNQGCLLVAKNSSRYVGRLKMK